MCCVVFDGYEEQSTKYHEHNRRQTGNVSALVIAENAKVHTEINQRYFQRTTRPILFCLLTTHLRDIGRHVEVIHGDVDTLNVASAPEFAHNGQTVTVVAEYTDVLIKLVYHWRNVMKDIFITPMTRRNVQREIGYQLDTSCDPEEAYYVHSCMKWL